MDLSTTARDSFTDNLVGPPESKSETRGITKNNPASEKNHINNKAKQRGKRTDEVIMPKRHWPTTSVK